MKLVSIFIDGALDLAINDINDVGGAGDVVSIVPGTRRRKMMSGNICIGTEAVQGHYIVMRVTDMRARAIEKGRAT